MTDVRAQAPEENVIGGGLLALLALPVGVVVLVLISSIGVVASIVGYLVAFAAMWLYRRGSGGVISRVGAWVVTAIVLATLLVGIWASMVVSFADGLGHLGDIGLPGFWPQFTKDFPDNLNANLLFIVLVLAFGLLGAFRTLRRAFATTRVIARPNTTIGSADGPSTVTPTVYRNDVDAAPTGSADDKTPPPTVGS